jgi:hypothetical protein
MISLDWAVATSVVATSENWKRTANAREDRCRVISHLLDQNRKGNEIKTSNIRDTVAKRAVPSRNYPRRNL